MGLGCLTGEEEADELYGDLFAQDGAGEGLLPIQTAEASLSFNGSCTVLQQVLSTMRFNLDRPCSFHAPIKKAIAKLGVNFAVLGIAAQAQDRGTGSCH